VTRLLAGRPGFNSRQRHRRDFSPRHGVQTGTGVHTASYPMGTSGSYSGIRRPERERDHSPPSSTEVKMRGAIYPLPNTPSGRGA
jgi:hypothetical protein